MKVALVDNKNSYSDGWISYLEENNIEYFRVNPYDNDVIEHILTADVFLWHFDHFNHKDALCAKSIIFSVQDKVKCFPNLNECFYFDDKLSQKYFLESLKIDIPKTAVFYDKKKALTYVSNAQYPLVAKLRKGAGSGNVWLLKNKTDAKQFIKTSFSKGVSIFNAKKYFRRRTKSAERNKKGQLNKAKSIYKMTQNIRSSKLHQREIGYVLFQEYVENDGYDLRALVINMDKVFYVRRNITEGNWSASGVGDLIPSTEGLDLSFVQKALSLAKESNSRCLAIDYIQDKHSGEYKVLEISVFYSYKPMNEVIFGYWDEQLEWHGDRTDPQRFLIDEIINN